MKSPSISGEFVAYLRERAAAHGFAPDAEQVKGIYSEIHAEFESKCFNASDLFGRGR